MSVTVATFTIARYDGACGERTVLWNAVSVRVPSRTHKEFIAQNLGFGVYRFFAENRRDPITFQYGSMDRYGFWSARQMASAHRFRLGKLGLGGT